MAKRTLIALATVLLLSLLSGCGGGGEDGREGSVRWHSFNRGLELARKEGKPVVIDFYTSWCKWCKVMEEKTFSHPKVSDYLSRNFVAVRIDAENRTGELNYNGNTYSPVQLTRNFGVKGFPSMAYLDSQGKKITVMPGYVPPETFLEFLKYINRECYRKQISFKEFQKRDGDCE